MEERVGGCCAMGSAWSYAEFLVVLLETGHWLLWASLLVLSKDGLRMSDVEIRIVLKCRGSLYSPTVERGTRINYAGDLLPIT